VLTSAYRMSANPNPAAHEIDPENRLLWRMNARRLEAETIRDSILAITGKLDLTAGGETLPTHSLETFAPNLSTFNPSQIIKTARLQRISAIGAPFTSRFSAPSRCRNWIS
jgi:hypothetical protein